MSVEVTTAVEEPTCWCPVCLEGFGGPDSESDRHNSRCGHPIHRHCLQALMRSGNYTCSICRMSYGDIPNALDQPQLKRYTKMLQQKLPIAAVRQRMEVDRIPPSVIDAFFTGGASTVVQDPASLAAENAKVVVDTAKFTKMLKVGMSEEAVRQKMESVGITGEDIDSFFCTLMDQGSSEQSSV